MWPHGLLQLLAGSVGAQLEGGELPGVWEARSKGAAGTGAVCMTLAKNLLGEESGVHSVRIAACESLIVWLLL